MNAGEILRMSVKQTSGVQLTIRSVPLASAPDVGTSTFLSIIKLK
jgi:hypothetical protein